MFMNTGMQTKSTKEKSRESQDKSKENLRGPRGILGTLEKSGLGDSYEDCTGMLQKVEQS